MAVARGKFRDELPAPVWVLLTISAIGIAIAGYLHGRLFHRGYAPVEWVGILFLLNLIASGATIVLLLLGRLLLFALGALLISGGSIVAILFSHSSSGFFGFHENGYDAQAKIIVAAEIVAIVTVALAWLLARGRLFRARLPKETAS